MNGFYPNVTLVFQGADMGQQTLEPISNRSTSVPLPISLRGTLADKYHRLMMSDVDKAACFIRELASTSNFNVERHYDGEHIVIGLHSERGRFFPDW